MKTLAWIALVLTVFLGGDGILMVATHYQPKTVNSFNLSDGGTIILSAVFMLIVTIIAFVADARSKQRAAQAGEGAKVQR